MSQSCRKAHPDDSYYRWLGADSIFRKQVITTVPIFTFLRSFCYFKLCIFRTSSRYVNISESEYSFLFIATFKRYMTFFIICGAVYVFVSNTRVPMTSN